MTLAAGPQRGQPFGIHGDDHPLLRFGEPDLPRLEARVLERHEGEVDVGADAVGHLADGGGQTARPTVGDRRPQPVGAGEHVDEQLLRDGIADLHAGAGDLAGRGVHRRAGERRPPDAVPAGAAAEHDDPVAGERPGGERPVGRHADAAAEHQRVGGETGVVEHGAGHGGEADLVAVVGDAGHHPLPDASRVQGAVGQLVDGQIGRTEAQHVGDGERIVAGAHHVPDDPADPGVGAAERLDGGRMVVRLGLQGERGALGERDDAGVAGERRADEGGVDRVGRRRAVDRGATVARRRRRRSWRGTSCARSARSRSGPVSPAPRRSAPAPRAGSGRGSPRAPRCRGPGRDRLRGGRGRWRRGRGPGPPGPRWWEAGRRGATPAWPSRRSSARRRGWRARGAAGGRSFRHRWSRGTRCVAPSPRRRAARRGAHWRAARSRRRRPSRRGAT